MKKTIIDYLTVLLGTGVGRGIAFLNSIIIARTLGKEDFGRFTIFFVVMVLTWMFPQAFDSVFVRYAKTARDANHKTEFLRVSFFLKSVYAVLAIALAYPVAWILAVVCFKKPEMTPLIVWAIVSGVFQAFLMTIASIFQEREKFNIFAFLYASYTILILAALVILHFSPTSFTLSNVIFIHVIVSIIIGGVSIALLLKRKIKRIWPLDQECLLKSANLGKWAFGSLIIFFTFGRLDTIFLPRYVPFAVIGVYGVAQQITMLISVMTGALNNIFLPKACVAVISKQALKKYMKESMMVSLGITIIIGVIILISGKLIYILYGKDYLSAQGVVQILLFGWIFYVLFLPFLTLFYAFEDSKTRFFIDLVRFCLAFMLLLYFIPKYEAFGAALAMTLSQAVSCIIGFLIFKKRLHRFEVSL